MTPSVTLLPLAQLYATPPSAHSGRPTRMDHSCACQFGLSPLSQQQLLMVLTAHCVDDVQCAGVATAAVIGRRSMLGSHDGMYGHEPTAAMMTEIGMQAVGASLLFKRNKSHDSTPNQGAGSPQPRVTCIGQLSLVIGIRIKLQGSCTRTSLVAVLPSMICCARKVTRLNR